MQSSSGVSSERDGRCRRRSRTSPATTPWASRKGMPRLHQQVGDVGGRDQLIGGGLAPCARGGSSHRDHPVGGGERQLDGVARVEQVLLVLLEVLVVGERERVHHAVEPCRWETTRGAFARSSSAASGFFFWGMIEEPARPGVGELAEAELGARPQHQLGAEAREVGGAGGGRAEVVEREVAVGYRVDRVGGGLRQSRAHRPRARGRCRS